MRRWMLAVLALTSLCAAEAEAQSAPCGANVELLCADAGGPWRPCTEPSRHFRFRVRVTVERPTELYLVVLHQGATSMVQHHVLPVGTITLPATGELLVAQGGADRVRVLMLPGRDATLDQMATDLAPPRPEAMQSAWERASRTAGACALVLAP